MAAAMRTDPDPRDALQSHLEGVDVSLRQYVQDVGPNEVARCDIGVYIPWKTARVIAYASVYASGAR